MCAPRGLKPALYARRLSARAEARALRPRLSARAESRALRRLLSARAEARALRVFV